MPLPPPSDISPSKKGKTPHSQTQPEHRRETARSHWPVSSTPAKTALNKKQKTITRLKGKRAPAPFLFLLVGWPVRLSRTSAVEEFSQKPTLFPSFYHEREQSLKSFKVHIQTWFFQESTTLLPEPPSRLSRATCCSTEVWPPQHQLPVRSGKFSTFFIDPRGVGVYHMVIVPMQPQLARFNCTEQACYWSLCTQLGISDPVHGVVC